VLCSSSHARWVAKQTPPFLTFPALSTQTLTAHADDIKSMLPVPWSQGPKTNAVPSIIEKRFLEASCGGAAAVIQKLLAPHW